MTGLSQQSTLLASSSYCPCGLTEGHYCLQHIDHSRKAGFGSYARSPGCTGDAPLIVSISHQQAGSSPGRGEGGILGETANSEAL
jgi:hypothetical protein